MRQTARLFVITAALIWCAAQAAYAVHVWTSPNHYRVVLSVNARNVTRRNSPAQVDINFAQTLANLGAVGTFDEDTIEVVGYNSSGIPITFDASRTGYEQYLLPWRTQRYYGISSVTLSFVMPNDGCTQYAVYFDTRESGLGKPQRYHGLVGDGDWFTEGYKKREICGHRYDDWCDFDGDGDLDLFKGGTEPYIYCYENVGGNRMVDRGRLTNNGSLWTLPMEPENNRTWHSVEFDDWDGDGDQDLFIFYKAGAYAEQLVAYRNITTPGGPVSFEDCGIVWTTDDEDNPTGGIQSTVTIVDWDGDGKKDMLGGKDGIVTYFRNKDTDGDPWTFNIAKGKYVQANGLEIQLWEPRPDCADLDGDGDLDMLVGMQDGKVYWFTNVGTRTSPVFTEGRLLVFHEGGYMDLGAGVKIADFNGDGLLDFTVGRYWERTHWPEELRLFGRLYKNIGTPTAPRFQGVDASGGCPYTEQFQNCDALRQNGVRGFDWDSDGRKDLIAGDTDGFVWFFRNTTNHIFPIFETGQRLKADGEYIRVLGEEERRVRDGYARVDITDWNEDGKKDLLVADARGWIWLFLNQGTPGNPELLPGTRLSAYNSDRSAFLPIDGTARSSVLVCDWDNDGKKDVIHAITGQGNYSEQYNWEVTGRDVTWESGFLFFKNIGTNASPELDFPKWIRDRYNNIITYNSRPNLGSFVDWDGDNKKDFITGEFESSVRFYRNTSTGTGAPRFNNTTGVHIVKPFTVQMCSGADAIDWNGDGGGGRIDIDILTGQGHGGSGLRFYERDYINDYTNNTFPTVTQDTPLRGYGITEAKTNNGSTPITVPRGIVTAAFTGYFYVESENRESGIRVNKTSHGLTVGQRVDVTGTVSTNEDDERYIFASTVTLNGSGIVAPLALTNKALGGSALIQGGYGQTGVTGAIGLNNIGLLIKTSGKCTLNLTGGDYNGVRCIFIDDGSGVKSWYRAAGGAYVQVDGVRVDVYDPGIAVGNHVIATGICSMQLVNGIHQARILTRAGMGDVVKVQ